VWHARDSNGATLLALLAHPLGDKELEAEAFSIYCDAI
jgi:hypothetical protein